MGNFRKMPRWAVLFLGLLCMQTAGSAEAIGNLVELEPTIGLPEDARQRGEHGEIVLEGDLVDGGTISQLAVIRSTGSRSLDEFVRGQLEGKKVPRSLLTNAQSRVRLKVALYPYRIGEFGRDYFCDQAVRDFDWYASTFPEAPFEKGPLYHLLSASNLLGVSSKLSFTKDPKKYEAAWYSAIAECRRKPEELFIEIIAKRGNA